MHIKEHKTLIEVLVALRGKLIFMNEVVYHTQIVNGEGLYCMMCIHVHLLFSVKTNMEIYTKLVIH